MLTYKLKNIKMATVHGQVEVDDKGVVKGLTAKQEKDFANLPGFTHMEDKKTTKKEVKPKEEKEEKKPTKKTTKKEDK
ncbi:hypothetical protein [Staphylococcus phage SAP6]|uniref:DUF7349 domain-containing protein n=5 Tax=Silviavirus remus TaxID=1857890 RepID=S4T8T1_9CAUD|nr:hypothetical protein QLX36_gp012 [Staphylococcus phage vB_SauM_Romulus]YP_008431146.1 hypothetical protein O151_gp163 [Staphylococcus phage vB_SauM_Remus]QVD57655.1 hypothetical protein PM56_110 [Staphylococcus phage PM56]QVD58548.1 hypothetical protein PM93_121 [Staphylococcus phage PM93]QVD58751.1 hypothetical protein Remus_120 [Silviavirus remus]QVD58942.1 hypothetical protein Romulus_110 [Staphylococcus phage Romulus]QXV86292.1 hypothetical protein [Staphylococcus phage SAPYZU_15]UVD4